MAGTDLDLDSLVDLLRPDLRRVLWTHRVPAGDAMGVMQGALGRAIELWDLVGDKIELLLAAVDEECLRYWEARGLRSPALRRPSPAAPAREVLELGTASVDLDLLRALLPVSRHRAVLGPDSVVARLRLAAADTAIAPVDGPP